MPNNRRKRLGQPQLKYPCGRGEGAVNLHTGELSFAYPDIEIGANTYQIAVAHVFNSQFNEATDLKRGLSNAYLKTGAGRGWKLNVQQYVFKDSDSGAYVYVDGAGYRHMFEKYDESRQELSSDEPLASGGAYCGEAVCGQATGGYYRQSVKHYDTDGLGLTLTIVNENRKTANGPVFAYSAEIMDEAGNRFVFNEYGNITEAVSAVNPAVKKIYTYTDNKLTGICDSRKQTRALSFEYNADGLIAKIKHTEGGSLKQTVGYEYESGNLVRVWRTAGGDTQEDGIAYFNYDSDKLVTAIDDKSKTALNMEYNSSDVTKVSSGVFKPDFTRTAYNQFDYNENDTAVTDNHSVKYDYCFRYEGEPTAIMEDMGSGKFRTVMPAFDSGIRLDPAVVDGGNFDCAAIQGITKQTTSGTYTKEILNVSDGASVPLKEINKTKGFARKFTVSAWVKINNSTQPNAALKLKATFNDVSAELFVDKEQLNSWQYVSGEIDLPAAQINNYKIEMTTTATNAFGMDVGGLRATRPDSLPLMRNTNNRICCVSDFASVNLGGAGSVTFGDYRVSPAADFMTGADIISTLRSMHLSPNSFEFFYNGRRKRKSGVSGAIFMDKQGNSFSLTANGSDNPYFYNETQPGEELRFFTWAAFEGQGDTAKIAAYKKAGKGNTETTEKTVYSKSGLLLEEKDEYGVQTLYTYGNYGNVTKAVTQHAGTGDKLLKRFKWRAADSYTGEGEVLEEESNALGKMVKVNCAADPFAAVMSKDAMGKMSVTSNLNAFRDLPVSTQYSEISGGSSSVNNDIQYGYSNGLLSAVTSAGNGYSASYAFGYDGHNVNAVSVNGAPLYERTYDYPERRFGTKYANESAYTYGCCDKYGRGTQTKLNGAVKHEVTYRDTNTDVSSSAKVRRITDNYANTAQNFEYDSCDKNLLWYNYVNGGYSVRISAENASGQAQKLTKYEYTYNTSYSLIDEVTEVYDPDKFINPRLLKLVSEKDSVFTAVKYEYDSLGRVTDKLTLDQTGEGYHAGYRYAYKGYTDYEEGAVTSTLPEKLYFAYEYSSNPTWKEAERYTYDDNCDVTKIEYSNPVKPAKTYTYDNFGRLTSDNGDAVTYDAVGNILSKTKGGVTATYTYDTANGNYDRLTSITKSGSTKYFSYDACGNPTRYKTSSSGSAENMAWTRGALLQSYDGTNFEYNALGVRTKKGDTIYYLDGDRVLAEVNNSGHITYEYGIDGIRGFRLWDILQSKEKLQSIRCSRLLNGRPLPYS